MLCNKTLTLANRLRQTGNNKNTASALEKWTRQILLSLLWTSSTPTSDQITMKVGSPGYKRASTHRHRSALVLMPRTSLFCLNSTHPLQTSHAIGVPSVSTPVIGLTITTLPMAHVCTISTSATLTRVHTRPHSYAVGWTYVRMFWVVTLTIMYSTVRVRCAHKPNLTRNSTRKKWPSQLSH